MKLLGIRNFKSNELLKKAAKLICYEQLADKIIDKKEISKDEFNIAWNVWSKTLDLDIYFVANLYIEYDSF